MTEKRQGPTPGVCLKEVSVKRELTVRTFLKPHFLYPWTGPFNLSLKTTPSGKQFKIGGEVSVSRYARVDQKPIRVKKNMHSS